MQAIIVIVVNRANIPGTTWIIQSMNIPKSCLRV